MGVTLHDSIDSFRTAAAPIYLRDPVAAVVELRILRKLPADSDLPPLLLTVSDRGALVGAAIQTPPFPLLCGGLPESAINDVVAEVAQSRPDLTGVRGPRAIAASFAETWCNRTGAVSRVRVEERLYRLDVLRPPETVEGESRPASDDDTEILVDWHARFRAEAMGDAPVPVVTAQSIRTAKQAGDEFLLWLLNGEPVSMAGVRYPTEGVFCIGPVYTPTDKRGHGFGSAVTAAAAAWAYAAGAKDVVLFTDLANPISNTIYQRIGFRPVTDVNRIEFSQPV
ncbi:MAG: GNAT family N-acetyltransferase [Mycobacterium sp.]|nr:GNAT family N-acetyltransferase [Mycobacterium sp.]